MYISSLIFSPFLFYFCSRPCNYILCCILVSGCSCSNVYSRICFSYTVFCYCNVFLWSLLHIFVIVPTALYRVHWPRQAVDKQLLASEPLQNLFLSGK